MSPFTAPLLTFFSLLTFVSGNCVAFDSESFPEVDVSGFATIAFGQTITDDKKEGALEGMSNELDFTYLNKLGLRLDTDFTNDLSFTLQAVANGNDQYQAKVDWAFIEYDVSNQVTLSLGKLRMPLYMLSEYRDVSYAYQWITPPYAVYGSPDFSSFDGGRVNYSFDFGDEWTSNLDAWLGRLKNQVEVGGIGGHKVDFSLDSMYGISLHLDRDWFSIRALYSQGLMTSDIAPIIVDQINTSPSPDALSLRDDLEEKGLLFTIPLTTNSSAVTIERDDVKFVDVGIMLDFEHVFFNAEATLIKSDPNIIVGRAVSYYALVGVKVTHDIALSLTFAKDFNRPNPKASVNYKKDFYGVVSEVLDGWEDGGHKDNKGNPVDPPSPEDIAIFYQVSEFLVTKKYATLDTKSYILNTRWDFHPTASLKAEYIYKQKTQLDVDSSPQAIRIAIDLVF